MGMPHAASRAIALGGELMAELGEDAATRAVVVRGTDTSPSTSSTSTGP
jgi:hypothetical protein